MIRPRRRFLQLAGAAALLGALPLIGGPPGAWSTGAWPTSARSTIAFAQSYPSRPIRWIVSFAAGGGNDIVARVMGPFLSEKLGPAIIGEDRGGGGGKTRD